MLVLRRGGRLIAVVPLFIDNSGGNQVIRLLGAGVSDFLDGLCQEEERSAVYEKLAHWLADELCCREMAEFDQLHEHAFLKSMPTSSGVQEELQFGTPCPARQLQAPHTFSFLRGREAYKYRWGAKDHQTFVRKFFQQPPIDR